MSTKLTNSIIFALWLFLVGASAWFYQALPEEVAIHWNAKGEVDGYATRFWGVTLMPIIMLGLWALFYFLSKKVNQPQPQGLQNSAFNLLQVGFFFFMSVIGGATLAVNLGVVLDITKVITVMFGGLFILLGYLLPKMKRNIWAGVRLPWTLKSDWVWQKTHQFAGRLFMILGVIILGLSFLASQWVIFVLLFLPIGVLLALAVYSYRLASKEKKGEE